MFKLKAYIELARPYQYIKNSFVWLPVFFGHQLLNWHALSQTFWAFLAFCLVASSVYVLNDLKDINEDRQHPVKCFRPLANGSLSELEAVFYFSLLLVISGLISFIFIENKEFFIIVGLYLFINILYSLFLKHIAIIDVICIAIGFVLRVFAGGIACNVPVSHWIIIMTFLLAIFLALAKRRDDLLLAADGQGARRSIDGYSLEFVSVSMGIMAAVVIVGYILYTMSPDTIRIHGTDQLYLTAFWVVVGLLRYLQISLVKNRTASPTKILLKDRFLQAVLTLWILSFFFLLYNFGGK